MDLRYRMFIRYRMSTYDIVGQTYDIVSLHENISYTISYVQKYIRCRTSVTFDIVRAHRIRYRMSITISYVYIRYRMLTYDIVRQLGHRMLNTTSYVNIRCRKFDLRHRRSVMKAPWIDFKFVEYGLCLCYNLHPLVGLVTSANG